MSTRPELLNERSPRVAIVEEHVPLENADLCRWSSRLRWGGAKAGSERGLAGTALGRFATNIKGS